MITKEKNRTKIICAVVTAISAIVAGGSAFQLIAAHPAIRQHFATMLYSR